MGLFNNWIIKQGARGLTTTLLTLYRRVALSGVSGERTRWIHVYTNPNSGLLAGNRFALGLVLDEEEIWDDPKQSTPVNIVERINMTKAMSDIGSSFVHPDFVRVIREGVARGVWIIRNRYPDIKI